MNIRALFLAGATLAIAAQGFPQVTKQGNGYLFRMKFAPGQVITYRTQVSSNAGGMKMNMSMPMRQTVKSVTGNRATLEMRIGPMTMNGRQMNTGGPAVQTQTVTIDSTGRANGGQTGLQLSLPQRPIPIGGTWTAELPMGGMMGPSNTTRATYRLVRLTKRNGRDVAEIAMTVTTTGPQALRGSGTQFVSVADGQLVYSNLQLNMTITPPAQQGAKAGPQKVSTTVVTTRA